MSAVLHIVLYVVLIIAVVLAFAGFAAWIIAYVAPRIKRISNGEANSRAIVECCPPGLGCNDPHGQSRKCMRLEARRIAKTSELIELERTWSNFCGVPRHHKKERDKAFDAYGASRDKIIARALNDVADMLDNSRQAALPRHLIPQEVMEKEKAAPMQNPMQ